MKAPDSAIEQGMNGSPARHLPCPEDVPDQILRVTRGPLTEVYRVRLLHDGSASLERFVNGSFAAPRLFRGGEGCEFDANLPNSRAKLKRAVHYIVRFLDGSVNIGERDLLSPTSALARNVRWFPGDIQMINTAFHYVPELFPSAQFHVAQLFRRVIGDAAFLTLILFTSAFWLRSNAPVRLSGLAITLQVASLVAIIGFDRFWEPIRYRFRRLTEVHWAGQGFRVVYSLPAFIIWQLFAGVISATLTTLIGLTNLMINPVKVLQSWRRVKRGRALEWKASSMSAGQDMRGWPLSEFTSVYAPATRAGIAALLLIAWLVLLGAPIELLGLNSLGIFVASFLTAALYAWYSALPHTALDKKPQYFLSRTELLALTSAGLAGLGVSALLWRAGMYPIPSFEGSAGIVACFLTFSAGFAFFYPIYYSFKYRAHAAPHARTHAANLFRFAPALLVAGATLLFVGATALGIIDRTRAYAFVRAPERAFRMPEPERRAYLKVLETTQRHAKVDPEPLLRAEGDQATLQKLAQGRTVDFRDLKGTPNPRLPEITAVRALILPELYPLPLAERISVGKPAREFLVHTGDPVRFAASAVAVGEKREALAERRVRAVVPRKLSRAELALQRQFIARADYPFITRRELELLAAPDATGAAVPLVEMARVERWDDIKSLWDRVPAARRGDMPARARLQRLQEGIDGAVSLGRSPNAAEVQRFLDAETRLIDDWSRRFPNIPFATARDGAGPRRSRYFYVTCFLLREKLPRERLASLLRLDYVNAYWTAAPAGESLYAVLRDQPPEGAWDQLRFDWDDNENLKRRWETLELERALAARMFRAAGADFDRATPEDLRRSIVFTEQVVRGISSGDLDGPYAPFAQLFRFEGVDGSALQAHDKVASALAARLWTQTAAGRLTRVLSKAASNRELPGTPRDRELLHDVASSRYRTTSTDPLLARAYDWLLVIDHIETYRELARGYEKFVRENRERGFSVSGLEQAPALSDDELTRDLVELWRELPERYPEIPARDPLVGEFICQTAYFSTRDGKHARSVAQFVADFSELFTAVNAAMPAAPPEVLQTLSERRILQTQGRQSSTERGRRFFAWWNVAVQTKFLQANFDRHGIKRTADLNSVATTWRDVLESGRQRWPRLPWLVPGFAEFFVDLSGVDGASPPDLWAKFERQLTRANQLAASHVVPFETFQSVVDHRIQEKTGAPNFDPILREANATLALAQILEVAHANGISEFDGNPARLTETFSLLYEKLAREYPHLYWQGEGVLEYYLLVALKEHAELSHLERRFAPEWSLANALAATGLFARFNAVALKAPTSLSARELALRDFLDVQNRRLEEKLGMRVLNPKTKAFNALVALSSLVLSAGEEGLVPEQHGSAWPKAQVRAWALAERSQMPARELSDFVETLLSDWSKLYRGMLAEGPHFPWHKGSIIETDLLMMRSAGASANEVRQALGPTFRAASDLIERGTALPEAFVAAVRRDSETELRRKIAVRDNIAPARVPEAEVTPEDPALVPLNAVLVVAEVTAQIRQKYREDPDASAIARRILAVETAGPERFRFIPWHAKGFVPSLVVAAYARDFRDDFWRYTTFIDMPVVDQLLRAAQQSFSRGTPLPSEIIADERAVMRQETGRTPVSDEVVAFQALRDGVFLLKEFLPHQPLTLPRVTTLLALRASMRKLSRDYPELRIVSTEDQHVRIGFAERLAATAMKQGIVAGYDPDAPAFVPLSVALMKDKFLGTMNRIYALVRVSFSPEELAYYREQIRAEARVDNQRRAAKYGLSSEALSVPDVLVDDVVSDFALYEILYAAEIGEGPEYLVDLFEIYDRLEARAGFRAEFHEGLRRIDGAYAGRLKRAGEPEYESWLASPEHATWWKRRGEFIKAQRGKLIALSRNFALIKRAGFSAQAKPDARASFARFGSFDEYLRTFFDDFEAVQRIPEFETALQRLDARDPFLADGVHFALALFKRHVIDSVYRAPAARDRALAQIAAELPGVSDAYQRVLGYAPSLESGVPLYDARRVFLRRSIEGGAGNELWMKLNLMQRSVQRWTDGYFIKQAYKILFYRDLDEEDPTPLPRFGSWGRLDRLRIGLEGALNRIAPHTLGDEVTDFLETRLPDALERRTGSHDVSIWIDWLMKHGELDLEGRPTGDNPYRREIGEYESRLAHYRTLVERGTASGKSVRAEQQRLVDIQREYASLSAQVSGLREAARQATRASARLVRDYREAVWLHGILLFACLLALGVLSAVLVTSRSGWNRRSRRSLLAGVFLLPAAASLGVIVAAARNPERAARFAPTLCTKLRLVERRTDGTYRARGAAAQIAKLAPWRPQTGDSGEDGLASASD